LFALGITPKVVIHTLVANHKDTHLASDHGKTDQFNKAGFHCTIDNLVVESPFLNSLLSIESELPKCFAAKTLSPYKDHLSFSHFIFGLRGPPATV